MRIIVNERTASVTIEGLSVTQAVLIQVAIVDMAMQEECDSKRQELLEVIEIIDAMYENIL